MITKKQVLEQANYFWKQFGKYTIYKTKKAYIKVALDEFKRFQEMPKVEQEKYLVERQQKVLTDLQVREQDAIGFIKGKDLEKDVKEVLNRKHLVELKKEDSSK